MNQKKMNETIERILQLKEEKKRIENELTLLENMIKAKFTTPEYESEILKTNKYTIKKIPINYGKNNFNVEKIKQILPKKLQKEVIMKVEVANVEKINELIKIGVINEETANNIRENKWSFKLQYNLINKEENRMEE